MNRFKYSGVVGGLLLLLSSTSVSAQTHVCVDSQDCTAFTTTNGGCLDLVAGLAWSRDQVEVTQSTWNWEFAEQMCADLTEGGFDDWRLPTVDELVAASNHDAESCFGYLYVSVADYWSSKRRGIWAWSVKFSTGEDFKRTVGSALHFACVRDPTACGDGTCDAQEDVCNCPSDCGSPAPESDCSDGVDDDCDVLIDCDDPDCAGDAACTCDEDEVCESDENQCDCPSDCGAPPAIESDCADGGDDDCDGAIDCDDDDCDGDEDCACLPKHAPCFSNSDCCSGNCRLNARCGGGSPN